MEAIITMLEKERKSAEKVIRKAQAWYDAHQNPTEKMRLEIIKSDNQRIINSCNEAINKLKNI